MHIAPLASRQFRNSVRNFWALAFLVVAGCGESQIDKLGKEKVRVLNALADETEYQAAHFGDKESIDRKDKNVTLLTRVDHHIKKLSDADQKAVKDKYGAEFDQIWQRWQKAAVESGKRGKKEEKSRRQVTGQANGSQPCPRCPNAKISGCRISARISSDSTSVALDD